MRDKKVYEIPIEQLKKVCDLESEIDKCLENKELFDLIGTEIIGQERAVEAMEFGLAMDVGGYNIFLVGEPGTGKSTYAGKAARKEAKKRSTPLDWCYVNNFVDTDKPIAVSLPTGKGRIFQEDMDSLVESLKVAIPKAFDSSDYKILRDGIYEKVYEKIQELYHTIEVKSYEFGFSIKTEGRQFIFIPLLYGRQITAEEYAKLPKEEQEEIEEKRKSLGQNLDLIMHEIQTFENEIVDQVTELDNERIIMASSTYFESLLEKYEEVPKVCEFLEAVMKDILDNIDLFEEIAPPSVDLPFFVSPEGAVEDSEEEGESEGVMPMAYAPMQGMEDPFQRYKVNLFVNNEQTEGAPVIVETNPYFYNLFGKVEYKSQLLSMGTDFTMVKAGAVHRANGGYLILQAKDIFSDPLTWEALKKVLKYKKAVIENIGENYRTVPTVALRPEEIPVEVKVIIIGSPIYYAIFSSDEEFKKLFKVLVDFDTVMSRNIDNIRKYISFVNSITKKIEEVEFSKEGLSKIIEYGSRIASSQKKLSTQFDEVSELVYESAFLAKKQGEKIVSKEFVIKALEARHRRFNKIEEKIQESVFSQSIIIDIKGEMIGQVNGLFVVETEGYSFGLPARITAQTYMGHGGVIHIERETEMSGNIHSKGVLTLSGYLGGKLAQNKPLGFTAQVTFEQLYDGVEGDSASSAELYAIISSLSGIPIKQSFAVTGSVDQRGDIQPIGGVNEKIEGFFDICKGIGFTGQQGVIIPSRNVEDLMLKEEVIEAVKKDLFQIYAIKTVEEGLEILTGVSAGEPDSEGNYPEGSIFKFVDNKLEKYHKLSEPEK